MNEELSSIDEFNPIPAFVDIYPLYWGIDKMVATRVYSHISDFQCTCSIRLGMYNTLKEKDIYCVAIIVDDFDKFEAHLQKNTRISVKRLDCNIVQQKNKLDLKVQF